MSVEIVDSKEFHSHDGFIHQWLSFGFLHHNGRTIEKELRVSTDYWILAIICFKLFGKDTGLEFTYRSERIFTPRTTPPCFQIVLAKLQEVVAKCSGVAHFAMIIISYKGIVCILLLLKLGLWSNANNSHFLSPILPSMNFFYDERFNISSYFLTKLIWINKIFNHLMTKDYCKKKTKKIVKQWGKIKSFDLFVFARSKFLWNQLLTLWFISFKYLKLIIRKSPTFAFVSIITKNS